MIEHSDPLAPDYQNACVTRLIPALLEGTEEPDWISPEMLQSTSVVLLVLDGLGWNQLRSRPEVAPTLMAMDGGAITTVAPSTTAAALTSITTGRPPGEHGLLGYRVAVADGVLNTLRWKTADGDARIRHDPETFQPLDCFGSQRPPVVTWQSFVDSGFTRAHLAGTRVTGFEDRAGLVESVLCLIATSEPFVYAYWDGIDHTAHEFGLADRYDEELAECDRMVTELLARLPVGTGVMVTADHGQVHVGDSMLDLPVDVTTLLTRQSGEARFRWLHARPGASQDLEEGAREAFNAVAWVHTAQEVVEAGWLGPVVTNAARERLGDVALVAREDIGFVDPAEFIPIQLIGRHGSLTSDEMLVPALGAVV